MNIFTPWAASIVREPYPVMIYIHGGNFDHGSGNTFPGQMLAASQEVVVVTFNYRLGLLGLTFALHQVFEKSNQNLF